MSHISFCYIYLFCYCYSHFHTAEYMVGIKNIWIIKWISEWIGYRWVFRLLCSYRDDIFFVSCFKIIYGKKINSSLFNVIVFCYFILVLSFPLTFFLFIDLLDITIIWVPTMCQRCGTYFTCVMPLPSLDNSMT